MTLPSQIHVADLTPELFRELILGNGAVLIRSAADPTLLGSIETGLSEIFGKYSSLSQQDFELKAETDDPVEKDFWQQMRLGHIYDRYFSVQNESNGLSFFDVLENANLRYLVKTSFPEFSFVNSAVTNCRRVNPNTAKPDALWDEPIEFHVDAQFFPDHLFSINFWTPLVACGRKAPGLEVVLNPVQETKEYLKYNPEGHALLPDDFANTHKFDRSRRQEENIKSHFQPEKFFSPALQVGDVLAFSNFTLHRTHLAPAMTKNRLSLEVRLDGTAQA